MRREERQNVSRPARIELDDGKTIACRIADLSSGGALLLVEDSEWLPKVFVLVDTFTARRRKVVLTWKSPNRAGIRFVDGRDIGPKKPTGFGRRT